MSNEHELPAGSSTQAGAEVATRPGPDENGIVRGERLPDPGLNHNPRFSDTDPDAAEHITRSILIAFMLVPIFAIAFVVIYFWPGLNETSIEFGMLHANAQHVGLGFTLGMALLLIGLGAVRWARQIMSDREIIEDRHSVVSSDEDRVEAIAHLDEGIEDMGSDVSRRSLLFKAAIGGVGLTALVPLVTLLDAGPWPLPSTRRETIERTLWAEGTPSAPMRLVNDVTWQPIKASDMEIGQLINAEPANLQELHGHEFQNAKAKAAIIIVRMDPNSIRIPDRRADWHVGGILAYSKICTHVGCPISLWEQQTHHLLCPCHQSTFDLGDAGKVVFGPAARALPQLPIRLDDEGYLVADGDFHVPVGPSYFERDFFPDDKGE